MCFIIMASYFDVGRSSKEGLGMGTDDFDAEYFHEEEESWTLTIFVLSFIVVLAAVLICRFQKKRGRAKD